MQTVVITGSARGFGLELARVFKKNNFKINNVIKYLTLNNLIKK